MSKSKDGAPSPSPFRKDPRREACPCFVAGAASTLGMLAADEQAAERMRQNVLSVAPSERYGHILRFLDLRIGELRVLWIRSPGTGRGYGGPASRPVEAAF
jgi:hypothetical protein